MLIFGKLARVIFFGSASEPVEVVSAPEPAPPPATPPSPPEMDWSRVPAMQQAREMRFYEPDQAARYFLRWLRKSRYIGYFTATEIDGLWFEFCNTYCVSPIPAQTLRASLQAVPGCYCGRRRLNIEFLEVKRRTGQDRAVLFHISRLAREQSGQPAAQPRVTRSHGGPPMAGQPSRRDEPAQRTGPRLDKVA